MLFFFSFSCGETPDCNAALLMTREDLFLHFLREHWLESGDVRQWRKANFRFAEYVQAAFLNLQEHDSATKDR